ncbi:MAG: M23 family metallopeptidase [Calothrix sp. C42_A2020_038]|nr:M23 family metallopeptidase [Calothrix sp. C42_A2020_038]
MFTKIFRPLLTFCYLFNTFAAVFTVSSNTLAQTTGAKCPLPALSRFSRHTVSSGETLESIAQVYNLTPKTILTMNPGLQSPIKAGNQILIPPYNGIIVEVPPSMTWRDIAKQYKIRADVLFEINGCQKNPRLVFVPQSKRPDITRTQPPSPNSTPSRFAGYPLASTGKVVLSYGWQTNTKTGEVFFHSGIDLLAPLGTSVLAIGEGTVAFAGEQGTYGNLVIINHGQGIQTRYAQLETIKVAVGQQVQQGEILGTVGATGKPTSPQPHLHFEVRTSSDLGWVAKNPQDYLK